MSADSLPRRSDAAQQLAAEAVREFGTGFRHGELTIAEETYEQIFEWALARLARWDAPRLNSTTLQGLRDIAGVGGIPRHGTPPLLDVDYASEAYKEGS